MPTSRPLALIAFLASTTMVPAQHREAPSTFTWEADLPTAVERSRATGKPILAFFTFDTCHWCEVLEEQTFPDADVRELAKSFHLVYVNRDVTPDLPPRFGVNSYPGLLVLGRDGENVHRFHGFRPPPEFLEEMREGLRRWERYVAGEEWWVTDEPEPPLSESHTFDAIAAPTQEVPAGICVAPRPDAGADDAGADQRAPTLWVAQGDELFWFGDDGWVRAEAIALPRSTQDLASGVDADGRAMLYVIASQWSDENPILVVEPRTGDVLRRITPSGGDAGRRRSPRGLCRIEDALLVLDIGGSIEVVDEATGEIRNQLRTGLQWTFGLTWDGEHLVCGSRTGLHFLDRESGRVVRSVPTSTYLRAVGHGVLPGNTQPRVLVMEQPIFGHGPHHERIVTRPKIAKVYALQGDAAAADTRPTDRRQR